MKIRFFRFDLFNLKNLKANKFQKELNLFMQNEEKTEKFRQLVENKFQIYNSLFMSLPYDKMTNIGMLLPFL